jgi:cell division protein FtsI (penicillin-binding protein 3)
VISELTAAQMRKMMEAVVLYGTGKSAQLNGYSSGGKTGTAQKIDPATHTYSKTMHIASFAGIAPVNNPVIAVAVVLDNPKGNSYYGGAVSAPVFTEVAQQVLEYLGVPHDVEVRAPSTKVKPQPVIAEDEAHDQGDINTMFAAINDLPLDDPLRTAPAQLGTTSPVIAQPSERAEDRPAGQAWDADGKTLATPSEKLVASSQTTKEVTLSESKKLQVPSLVGLEMRQVIVQAAAAGLEVQFNGSGKVREQAPAAGTMVASGTQIVVHCAR